MPIPASACACCSPIECSELQNADWRSRRWGGDGERERGEESEESLRGSPLLLLRCLSSQGRRRGKERREKREDRGEREEREEGVGLGKGLGQNAHLTYYQLPIR
jgi:hypothetical protein